MPDWPVHYRTTSRHFNIEGVWYLWKAGAIDADPPYQRGLVWSLEKKQLLIDSVARGLGVPALYFLDYGDGGSPKGDEIMFEVIDGKQRLTTIMDFMEDGFRYNGCLFSEMPPKQQRIFKNTHLPTYTVTGLAEEQKLEIFDRLNFCGVPHTATAAENTERNADAPRHMA